jgi:hypothetical protein
MTGRGGGKKRQPDAADELIYDIIGRDSPVAVGLNVRESGDNREGAPRLHEVSQANGNCQVQFLYLLIYSFTELRIML